MWFLKADCTYIKATVIFMFQNTESNKSQKYPITKLMLASEVQYKPTAYKLKRKYYSLSNFVNGNLP